jgi:hypothetical protein
VIIYQQYLIAQLTENPALNPIFNDIFDADGAAINIYPIENYAELGKETKYVDIVNIGIKYKESVIGVRIDNLEVNDHTEGVYLNPSKNKSVHSKKRRSGYCDKYGLVNKQEDNT